MPYLTNEEVERRKAAGVKMHKLNCGWNISAEDLAEIGVMLRDWIPANETERRDKHICELAFIQNMNASQIARLNDPLIVGMGNRSRGKPLSPGFIVKVCHKYAPNIKKRTDYAAQSRSRRNQLFRKIQTGEIQKPRICATCGSKKDTELHHIIPIEKGGNDEYWNLIYLCHDCHMKIHHELYEHLP